ncbi:CPBP family intramembrane glutamic endopeptidase [Halalkalibacter okhensis]|nr:CPBP family intramembrane glutamic endopeptidase [Halalkalibacter okhensis]
MPFKQKLGIYIILLLIIFTLVIQETSLLILIIGMSFPLLTMSIGFRLFNIVKFPVRYRYIPLLFSMLVPIILFQIPITWVSVDFLYYLVVISGAGLLLLSRIRSVKKSIEVSSVLEPINLQVYFSQLLKITTLIICEELLFRAFYFSFFSNPGIFEVLIGGLLFTYYHYYNRFAISLFHFTDYIYHFLLGSFFGFCLIYFDNGIIPLILAHLIYNVTDYLTLTKRTISYYRWKGVKSFDENA